MYRIIQRYSSHLKILDAIWVTWPEGPEVLRVTVRHLVAPATLCTGFVHPYATQFRIL